MTQLVQKSPVPANVPLLTVSQITAQIKGILEHDFARVWVVGEISSLSPVSRNGHRYFRLKDAGAILKSALFAGNARNVTAELREGLEVIVRGRLSVYPPRGDYEFIVEELYPKGAGAQETALRRLKEKLHKLGYFAPERKRPLPRFPRRMALVTSPIGAAIRDMLEILLRRWPSAEILVCPVRVVGDGAADSIAAGLALLNRLKGLDVVILGRGGGSSDDLSAFNDEKVAHAIYQCKYPVVSAVGHEIDVTLADLVADRRALTPSEAAELCTSPGRDELIQHLRIRGRRMNELLLTKLRTTKQRLRDLAERRAFRYPLERLRERERALDDWEDRLRRAMLHKVRLAQQGVAALAAQLESLSPLNVLARGYSLTRAVPGGDVIRDAGQVEVGDAVEVLLQRGKLIARVEEKQQ